ncbi:ammonia-forming cytochrome c nitrite reductase [Geoalkalibacter subterraneus]|uniref:nitrite reductase (cytochrome; ammonia-forming) n=1 Tax=Geoalkalibacter subterraneus TaxID=483547 RepID=A0A0B5FSE2_9BACT|nr:ammonia-forming cytochrome c nitrite reductase [Geoalkalibacter subterraneus]AJF07045.1 cytochrome C nitrite reductase [Geoalkalibacter subterraneus]
MKKSWIITIVSLVIMVPLLLLLVSIKENKAEQQAINAVPDIKKLDPRSSEWGKYFPRQYDSYIQTRKSDEIKDILKDDPNLVVLWAGYGFSKDYNAPRGHFYALEDNINTLRTGAPVDEKTGPMPTACWTCKSPDVPRLIDEIGEHDYFTGAWARFGGEIVNSIGCADCHNNETMQLNVTRDYLKRALDAEGSLKFSDATHQDLRSLVCAQCHVEYYFKPTKWTDENGQEQTAKVVTLPWNNGFAAEDMEEYYDERDFSDWTHKLSKTPMLKAQHPGYETFITGAHGQNGLACADCHMPYVREGGVKYSNHKVGSPLDDIANTCLNCHQGTEKEFKAKIDRKLERKNELAREATDILAKAHLEAARAWELGATEEDMKAALQDIRHGQWRWDYAVAAHGAFFHAPEEILRVLGGAINKAHDARLKLRVILAELGDTNYEAPAYASKEEAQELVGLPMDELVEEKKEFINGLKQEWFEMGKEKGIYDPKLREGMKLKTSFN